MRKSTETFEATPQQGATRRRWRKVLIGSGAAIAVAGLVAACHLPVVSQSAEIQAPATATSSPRVGSTAGYNITNESGAILIYQRVAGHVAAPPLQPGGAWLPGQTLNFELNTGTLGGDANTGDALFEAYTLNGPNGETDAGTVDVHFNSKVAGGGALAYLNPSGTAPLVASSNASPTTADGETWTMVSNGTNVIKSMTPQTYTVSSYWTFAGTNADYLVSAITAAPASQCITQDKIVVVCTLGGNTWRVTPGN